LGSGRRIGETIPQHGLAASDLEHVDGALDADWHEIDDEGRVFLEEALSGTVDAHGDLLVDLLDTAVTAGASDLHLSAGLPPYMRVRGDLRPLAGVAPLSDRELNELLTSVLTHDQRTILESTGDLDAALGIRADNGPTRRFRASIFRQSGSLAAAIRVIPAVVPVLSELGLPPIVGRFSELTSGLVLVTGPTGSGKSTTLAAMVEQINQTRSSHIVTIEDPIEYRYVSKLSVIQQREVGSDTKSFVTALRSALRQDPDVVLIGELRDLETLRIALTAAETGHVVYATLHSSDATSSINRIIDVFPPDQQSQIRSQLALSIEGCISQKLVKSVDGNLIAATEVMVATPAVRNLIRVDKVHQLPSALEMGGEDGMHTFDQSLADLVRRRRLMMPTAIGVAHSTKNLETLVRS